MPFRLHLRCKFPAHRCHLLSQSSYSSSPLQNNLQHLTERNHDPFHLAIMQPSAQEKEAALKLLF